MMANVRLMIAVIIGVLQLSQVCKAKPVSVGEVADVTKLFSASELQRARDVGIDDQALLQAKSIGFSFEKTIKFQHIIKTPDTIGTNVDFANKFCEFLLPGYTPAANYSKAEKMHFNEIVEAIRPSTTFDEINFIRTSVCAYLSQPPVYESEASSFGLQLVPYMNFRFFKLTNRNASGVERVYVAKKLCCMYRDRVNTSDLMDTSTFSGLPDGELSEFDERWNQFETINTSKSFESICDFLRLKNPSDECGSVQ